MLLSSWESTALHAPSFSWVTWWTWEFSGSRSCKEVIHSSLIMVTQLQTRKILSRHTLHFTFKFFSSKCIYNLHSHYVSMYKNPLKIATSYSWPVFVNTLPIILPSKNHCVVVIDRKRIRNKIEINTPDCSIALIPPHNNRSTEVPVVVNKFIIIMTPLALPQPWPRGILKQRNNKNNI